MILRYLTRLLLLTTGFALTTKGILAWADMNFDLATLWPLADTWSAHPVYVLILGLALIPPTLWELFILESDRKSS
ncbi:MAG: hypothetical protein AAF513_17805 [Pseudomonadota bacterium]